MTDAHLDAAFSVNSLVMNGGLDHAFEVVGDQFPDAIEGFQIADRKDIADLVGAFVDLVGVSPIPGSTDERAALLERLDAESLAKMQVLVDAYDHARDPQPDIERVD